MARHCTLRVLAVRFLPRSAVAAVRQKDWAESPRCVIVEAFGFAHHARLTPGEMMMTKSTMLLGLMGLMALPAMAQTKMQRAPTGGQKTTLTPVETAAPVAVDGGVEAMKLRDGAALSGTADAGTATPAPTSGKKKPSSKDVSQPKM
jgi:hypothetical protein